MVVNIAKMSVGTGGYDSAAIRMSMLVCHDSRMMLLAIVNSALLVILIINQQRLIYSDSAAHSYGEIEFDVCVVWSEGFRTFDLLIDLLIDRFLSQNFAYPS